MARQVKVKTSEMGALLLLLVSQGTNGCWEFEWEPLRGTPFGDLFSTVTKENLEHALKGWARPLVLSLGIGPEGALVKAAKLGGICQRKKQCPLFDPRLCFPNSPNMPWCYEPDGVADETVRFAATRAIEYWRNDTYVVIVKE